MSESLENIPRSSPTVFSILMGAKSKSGEYFDVFTTTLSIYRGKTQYLESNSRLLPTVFYTLVGGEIEVSGKFWRSSPVKFCQCMIFNP